MTRMKKVRMVVLVRPELLDKYRTLAAQYGVSRNDLCRYALEHGYQATVAWCRRQHEILAHDDRQYLLNLPGGASPTASSSSAGAAAVPVGTALRRYAEVVVRQEAELTADGFRTLLSSQALVLGLSGPAAEPVVEAVVAEHFPVPVDGVEGHHSADESIDADSDPDSELPALDPAAPLVDLD